jgi:hypothetical protein
MNKTVRTDVECVKNMILALEYRDFSAYKLWQKHFSRDSENISNDSWYKLCRVVDADIVLWRNPRDNPKRMIEILQGYFNADNDN